MISFTIKHLMKAIMRRDRGKNACECLFQLAAGADIGTHPQNWPMWALTSCRVSYLDLCPIPRYCCLDSVWAMHLSRDTYKNF